MNRLLNLIKRPLLRSGRKAVAMSVTTVPVSSPSDDRLGKLIDAVGQIARQQQSLLETLRPTAAPPSTTVSSTFVPPSFVPPTTPTPAAGQGDIRSIVADLFRQHAASAAQSAARDAYVCEHLADLPDAYRRMMPNIADPAALADAEQSVRRQYRQDLASRRRSTGFQPVSESSPHLAQFQTSDLAGIDLPGDDPGGQPPAAAIDYDKLSSMQQIALGLKSAGGDRRPVARPARAAPDPGQDARAPGSGVRGDLLDGEPLFVGAD